MLGCALIMRCTVRSSMPRRAELMRDAVPMICVSHMTALDAEPELMVEAAARAGFDGVGLRIFPPRHAPNQYPITGDAARSKALRRLADDQGIRIFEAESFGLDAHFLPDAY